MKYAIFTNSAYIFNTYREAEIFCGENGIHPEEIYEIEEGEEI